MATGILKITAVMAIIQKFVCNLGYNTVLE
jgi:hypothetical protein